MSTNYTLSIRRKKDDKEIAKFLCNYLKSIFDSEFAKYINCNTRYSYKNEKFDYNDLSNMISTIQDKIALQYKTIQEKKFLIALSQNTEVKSELEEEISYIENEIIPELFATYYDASVIQGSIITLVENNIKLNESEKEDFDDNVMAYKYNAEGLKSEDDKYSPCLWADDIYCVIED
jgi:hypothetical protein